jgi:8-oxo-dGTP pyrophosphatase MutT (NUDIX family)
MHNSLLPPESLYNIGVKAAIINKARNILLLHVTREHGAYWDLPGGRILDGEEPEQTLKREVKEETGIEQLIIERHLVMALSGVRLPILEEKKAGVIFSLYLCFGDSENLQPEERISASWCTIADAADYLRTNPDYPNEVIDTIGRLKG